MDKANRTRYATLMKTSVCRATFDLSRVSRAWQISAAASAARAQPHGLYAMHALNPIDLSWASTCTGVSIQFWSLHNKRQQNSSHGIMLTVSLPDGILRSCSSTRWLMAPLGNYPNMSEHIERLIVFSGALASFFRQRIDASNNNGFEDQSET